MDAHDGGQDMAMTTMGEMGGQDMGGQAMGGHDMGNSMVDPSEHGTSQGHYFTFHLSYDTVILFSQWVTSSWQEMLYSCLGLFVLAVLYEAMKAFREMLYRKVGKHKSGCQKFCNGLHFLQTLLHMVQMLISYLLMLVFMTFNGYLCIAVILGMGLGYCIFRWSFLTSNLEVDDDCCV